MDSDVLLQIAQIITLVFTMGALVGSLSSVRADVGFQVLPSLGNIATQVTQKVRARCTPATNNLPSGNANGTTTHCSWALTCHSITL